MTEKTGADSGVQVIELPEERLEEAAALLARSFHDDPNHVHFFPDEGTRARALPREFALVCRDALGLGHVYAASRDGELVGVAAWLPPGGFPLSLRRQLRAVPDMVRILAAAPRSSRRLLQFTASATRMHPAQPYWYLLVVGVEPAMQGLGIGTRLLAPVFARADEEGLPCYLETDTERNVVWYRKLGFEVIRDRVSFTPGGPPFWTMLRSGSRRPEPSDNRGE